MKNFLRLTNFELNRIAKLLMVLMGVVLFVQLIGVIYGSFYYLGEVDTLQKNEGLIASQILERLGYFDFNLHSNSILFFGPIFISVGTILFYIFLIWYRDWFGKNTFVYRLLMLPTERMNIFFSKLATILIATLSLVAFQLLIVHIEMFVMNMIVPSEFVQEMSVSYLIETNPVLGWIAPTGFDLFLVLYGIGIFTVVIFFTAILFERSYSLKGIFLGLCYTVLANVVVLLPIFLNEMVFDSFLYYGELILVVSVIGVIVLALSLWISKRLLNEKISV